MERISLSVLQTPAARGQQVPNVPTVKFVRFVVHHSLVGLVNQMHTFSHRNPTNYPEFGAPVAQGATFGHKWCGNILSSSPSKLTTNKALYIKAVQGGNAMALFKLNQYWSSHPAERGKCDGTGVLFIAYCIKKLEGSQAQFTDKNSGNPDWDSLDFIVPETCMEDDGLSRRSTLDDTELLLLAVPPVYRILWDVKSHQTRLLSIFIDEIRLLDGEKDPEQ
ncbi:hypothetical protein B0J17DRAFT_632094 [Rhizoctonia solani]|nr:hypothetical protein B0J17DRAFT_632094 [Rhizoctonia solani]